MALLERSRSPWEHRRSTPVSRCLTRLMCLPYFGRGGVLRRDDLPVLDIDLLSQDCVIRQQSLFVTCALPLGQKATSVEELWPVFLRESGNVEECRRDVNVRLRGG